MLKTDKLHVSMIELVRGIAPPQCGSWIQVAGYPVSDLYAVNFTRCLFRQIQGASGKDTPEKVSLSKLTAMGYDMTQIAPFVAGREIILRGPVCRDDAGTAPQGHFSVDCCGFHVPVDVGLSGIDPEEVLPGSTVEATGIGVLDCDNWRPDMTFPRLRGFFVVMRSPDDLRILAPPPWWTKGRLLALVAGLTLMLAAISALACWLRSLVAKKSRELFDEQIERTSSELRIDERTRLAVELHDTLSQNLEGVACQVAATKAIMGNAAPEARECLFAAERMLESSRKEMRRVLFDLRSDTLAEKDFSSALGKAIAPIAKGISLAIRFNIDRAIFSDSTAHAVICIVRELVSNAVVHGHASHIRIAGDRQGDILRFSVRDDGCGFDPASAKGPDCGHFGLSGIRERVRRIKGQFAIDSSVGGPTRATVTINLAHSDGTASPQRTEP